MEITRSEYYDRALMTGLTVRPSVVAMIYERLFDRLLK